MVLTTNRGESLYCPTTATVPLGIVSLHPSGGAVCHHLRSSSPSFSLTTSSSGNSLTKTATVSHSSRTAAKRSGTVLTSALIAKRKQACRLIINVVLYRHLSIALPSGQPLPLFWANPTAKQPYGGNRPLASATR